MTRTAGLLSLMAASAFLAGPAATVHAAGGRAPAELILMHLPAPGSSSYEELRQIAGTSDITPLELTGGELWLIPRTRLAPFYKSAGDNGVEIIRADRPNARLFAPVQRSTPMIARQKNMMGLSMAEHSAIGMAMMSAAPAPLVELQLKNSMQAMHAGGSEPTLRLPLGPDRTVTARPISIEKTSTGYAWSGEVVGSGEPVTFLWSNDGRITGSVTLGGHIYAIRPMGGMMHGVIDQSAARMPSEHAPAPAGMMEKMGMRSDPLVMQGDASILRPRSRLGEQPGPTTPAAADGNETITLLVAYTAAAARHYDEITRDLVALAIEEANHSFRMSGIENVKLKLIHSYQTDYVESGTHFDHLWRFADKGDGFMDEVHGERDRVGADVAVLIVDDEKGCGLSTRVAADPEEGFAVVHHGCAAAMYSLAHEIGHLIGARHDPALDTHDEPFAYGHGYINGKKWRTMMSYKDACDGCMRLPIWSSPDVLVKGERAGSVTADNARVVREGAARVARFREDPVAIRNAAAAKAGAQP